MTTQASDVSAGGARDPDHADVLARFQNELALVEVVARQVGRALGNVVEHDELVSAGREGLLQAARRFDPERGIAFRVYANYRVKGAMIDAVRRIAGLPRRAYQRLSLLERAAEVGEGEAAHALAADRRDDRFAEPDLREQLAGVAMAAALNLLTQHLLDQIAIADEQRPRDPERAYERAEELERVRRVLDTLPKEEAEVVRLHYFDGRRMEDIASDLEVSKSWISRLHTRAMARLVERLRGAQ